MKYIIVTGGIISGIGKGITASSIGLLFKSKGINVTAIKIDPYINIDAGTMSPYEHGECYVLADGGEVDLDLGNYERFLDIELTKNHNITTGKIYNNVINKERNGDYLGKTVQIIPHITNEIKNWIKKVSIIPVNKNQTPEICIVEIGGTIGDIETASFIEAVRQMSLESVNDNFCFIHVSMIIDNGDLKTKPTQHSVAKLRSLGILPDFLVMRTSKMLLDNEKRKLNMFCQVPKEHIISNIDIPNVYYVPSVFKRQRICEKIEKILGLEIDNPYELNKYNCILDYFDSKYEKIKLTIAGKYTGSQDTYLSLIKAIEHASFKIKINVEIAWHNTEDDLHSNSELKLSDGIIIPGGFGTRGIQGKINIAKYARINNIPLLGICLGMQTMVVEFSHNIKLNGYSTEWDQKTNIPLIDILPNQTDIKGGTMRLGDYKTTLKSNTQVSNLYKKEIITERHRHRYEVNNTYVDIMEKNGLKFVGTSNNGKLMEIIELDEHPFYIGCQFHPEFKSKYDNPHPLFIGLLESMLNKKKC